jgi:branched-chain amino acid transport system ATP-binding protein
MSLLEIRGLTVRFGGLVAINDLDLTIRMGQIFALVGPNGAGKTTVLNCVSGFVRPEHGTIRLAGTDLLPLGRDMRARLGIGRTFQNVQLFSSMSVLDNLVTAQHSRLRAGMLSGMLPFGRGPAEDARARERAREMLALLDLEAYADVIAGTLPLGARKLVGVARALVLKPRLVLLDEPAAGVPHAEVTALAEKLRSWRDTLGATLLLIEHNMALVQAVADSVCALNYGSKLAEGNPREVLSHPSVLEAYLGREAGSEAGSETGSEVESRDAEG